MAIEANNQVGECGNVVGVQGPAGPPADSTEINKKLDHGGYNGTAMDLRNLFSGNAQYPLFPNVVGDPATLAGIKVDETPTYAAPTVNGKYYPQSAETYRFDDGAGGTVDIEVTEADRTNQIVVIYKVGNIYEKDVLPLGFEIPEIPDPVAPDENALDTDYASAGLTFEAIEAAKVTVSPEIESGNPEAAEAGATFDEIDRQLRNEGLAKIRRGSSTLDILLQNIDDNGEFIGVVNDQDIIDERNARIAALLLKADKTQLESLKQQVDNLILNSDGTQNAEVVAARSIYPLLNDRLNAMQDEITENIDRDTYQSFITGRSGSFTEFNTDQRKTVLLVGTSIQDAGESGSSQFIKLLQSQYGKSRTQRINLGLLGGVYVPSSADAYDGWLKQNYGGLRFYRITGDPTVTAPLTFSGYGNRCVVTYSTEVGGGTGTVTVSGITKSVDCDGAQSINNELVFDFDNDQKLDVSLNVPDSGVVYFETINFYTEQDSGIDFIRGTRGGSSLRSFMEVGSQETFTRAPIAVDGFSTLDGLFLFRSENYNPELVLFGHTVNDAGNGMTDFNNYYIPGFERVLENCRVNQTPLVVIIEMGGHYIFDDQLGNSSQYTTYLAVVEFLKSKYKDPLVTIVDWNAATLGDLTLQEYVEAYYTFAQYVSENEVTGDFIHPRNGNDQLTQMLATATGVNASINKLKSISTSTITSPSQVSNSLKGFNSFVLPDSLGLMNNFKTIGFSCSFLGAHIGESPLMYSDKLLNYCDINKSINNSNNKDKFGKYVDLNGGLVLLSSGFFTVGKKMTLTLQIADVTAFDSFSAQVYDSINGNLVDAFINDDLYGGASGRFVPDNTRPRFASITVEVPATGGLRFLVTGRVYSGHLTYTDFPCLSSADFSNKITYVKQPVYMNDTMTYEQFTLGQIYRYLELNQNVVLGDIKAIESNVQDVFGAKKTIGFEILDKTRMEFEEFTNTQLQRQRAYNADYGGIPVGISNSGLFTTSKAWVADAYYTIAGTKGIAKMKIQLTQSGQSALYYDPATETWGTTSVSVTDNDYLSPQNFTPFAYIIKMPDATTLGAGTGLWQLKLLGDAGDPFSSSNGIMTVAKGKKAILY